MPQTATRTLDQCAWNLALDLGLADQDLWLRHLLVSCESATEFSRAVTKHIDLPSDDLESKVWGALDTWGIQDALDAFDDLLDEHEPPDLSPLAFAAVEREYEIDITIPNRILARS